MERVQQPGGATSGVRVRPLSKGIGEGTVQRAFSGEFSSTPHSLTLAPAPCDS
jgi:hypothetical protein